MSTIADRSTPTPDAPDIPYEDKPEGPISAAIIAAGLGALFMGIITTISEASTSAADWLQFSDKVGPLSGKVIITVIACWCAGSGCTSRYAGRSTSPEGHWRLHCS